MVDVAERHGVGDPVGGRAEENLPVLEQGVGILVEHPDPPLAEREEGDHREGCEGRLRAMVSQAAVRPKVRKKTKPTWGSVQRRLEGKKKQAERKQSRRWDDER